MSWSALCPVEHMGAANAALAAAGHGATNFSVPCLGPDGLATHAGFHCWAAPAFRAAVEALPYGIVIRDEPEAPPAQFAALALDHIGIPWPPADDWMDHLPAINEVREFDGVDWRNLMAGNPYAPPHGWEMVAPPAGPQVWSSSGFYAQPATVTGATGTPGEGRTWTLQTATETAGVGREPWQAYMWAVWAEVT
jgi:hypothetical protein